MADSPEKKNGNGGFKWSSLLQFIPLIVLIIAFVVNWNTMNIKLNQHELDMARIQLLLEAEITRGETVLAQKDADLESKLTNSDTALSARQDTFRARMDIADGIVKELRDLQTTEDTATQVTLGQIRVQLTFLQNELNKIDNSGG